MNVIGKKLLILGANPETAGLVKKANEMGVITYVTDYDANAYAKQFAANPCNIDASDVDALYELVKAEKIDGVMVGVAERLLPAYYALCERLHYPCFGTQALFDMLIDKKQFKDTCRKYDVPVVPEFQISDYSDEKALDTVQLPVVVKPVDSCSSKGISVCKTRQELTDGVQKALSFSPSKTILIEKYMTGEEIVIYYIIQDGEPSCVALCDRYTNKEQPGVAQLPTSYIFPSKHTDAYLSQVDEKVKVMLRDLDFQNGTLFIQSFVEDGSVYFYEPGFRLNGAQEHYIVNAATGIDAKACLIHFAFTGSMAEEPLSEKANPCFPQFGCKLSPLVKTGHIATLRGLEEIAKLPEIVSINPSYVEGDTVDGLGTLKQIICRFFLISDTKAGLKSAIDQVLSKLEVLDDNGNSMLLTQFDTDIVLTYKER